MAARDLTFFYRTLAQMLGAGVIASEALRGCAAALPEAGEAAEHVAAGEPISSALARFPKVIPAEHLHLMAIGERSGFLDVVLKELADYTEQVQQSRLRLRSGLMLPAMMLHIAAFVLPLPTLILGGNLVGYLASAFGFLAVLWLTVVAVVAFVRHAPLTTLDAVARRLPVVRGAWRELDLWRITAALRLFTCTSTSLPESLRFVSGLCRVPEHARALRAAADAGEQRGEPASPTLKASGVFPTEMLVFWTNGETTGRLDEAFARLAERHAESFQRKLEELSRWLPRFGYWLTCLYFVVQIFRAAGAYTAYLNQS